MTHNKAHQDVKRRPYNQLGDLAQAALDQLPTDVDESKHMIPVADVRARFEEIRDLAYGYDARYRGRLDASGKKRKADKAKPEV